MARPHCDRRNGASRAEDCQVRQGRGFRWGLRPGRPIWADKYDKRFCLDEASAHARIEYVERHNTAIGLPAKPWSFIESI